MSSELDKAKKASDSFLAGENVKSLNTQNWTTHHWLYFLRSMKGKLDVNKMQTLDNHFKFTASGNSEIQCEWYLNAIATGYTKAYPNMEKFLMSVGRRKFLKPIYTALSKTPENLELARKIYEKARPGYHAVSIQTLDEILKN